MAHEPRNTATGHAPDAHHHPHHPSAGTYVKVGLLLTVITIIEVYAYYVPAWVAHWSFVPSLLIMSAVKFLIVVSVYMHLKYDHRLFRALFVGPFVVAALTLIGLMFLFGHLSIRLGLLA
ncbi:cytochrome C oxidase subunit IV family protein [Roseisolibacter sp. H3M3-2]|uniref:cytochrome C oxidase subunit IV family protein n=1 Tax=Roseisolibacter sp. H3M3-2 TaxID=3031323 RepID=UPI0023DAD7B3|nr:cytochrome C oxidase subunit IV family protein [Roseisolibacter sp. H3M3-2]MDF1504955.1 cytochrome C oxidase subunit IV family protein [Roseisolibacter sp. H3M3-2]